MNDASNAAIENSFGRTLHKLSWAAYIIFLIIYSYQKFIKGYNGNFEIAYIQSTGLVVLLTAILPIIVTIFALKIIPTNSRIKTLMAALVTPLALSFAGLALYFYMFIAPNVPNLGLDRVLPRALIPGLIMSGISLFYAFTRSSPQKGAGMSG